ncbi:MAG: hypothetical protein J6K48_08090 [Lachnospiraceae bacterium]|nr:hypothetical protein [Lachnospiraceae bacterium]
MKEELWRIGKENSLEVTMEEACYFGFFILLSITKGLGFYEGQKLFALLVIPALVLGLAKIFLSSYTKRQMVLVLFLLAMTAIVYYNSRELGIVFMAFTVLGMKNIPVKKVFHAGLWGWSVCAVFLSIFSFFRLEHTIYRVHSKMGLGHIFRWSLGFTHPNILHITYLALCAFILYELGDKYKFKHFVYLMAGNVLVFLYSISYTGFGIVAVLLMGCLYVQIRPRFCMVEKILANLILPVCLVLSFVLPFYINYHRISPYIQKLNFMLNTRIWLAEQFLKSEYRSLFGADISKVVNSTMTMDNSYVWGYINFGLIPFVMIILGYFALLFYDTHKQKTRELVIIVCFLGAGWTEPLLFNTSFKNITLVFLGAFLLMQKEGEKEYCLFPKWQKRIVVPFAALPDHMLCVVKAVWTSQKKRMILLMAAGALLGVLLCGVIHEEPTGYVVQRFYTDGLEETSVYLESKDDPAYEGYRIMNYKDADTPMQIVSGKAVKLETVRYYVGSVMIGGLAGAVFGVIFWSCSNSRTAVKRYAKQKKS